MELDHVELDELRISPSGNRPTDNLPFWSPHLALSDKNKHNENRSRNVGEEAIFVILGINLHKLP